jgi:uncharacterized membrane protein YczE
VTTLLVIAAALLGAVCFIGFSSELLQGAKRCLVYLVIGLGLSAFAWLQDPVTYLVSVTILFSVGVVVMTPLIYYAFSEPRDDRKE